MRANELRPIHRTRIVQEWLDYNGHLNEAYYVLIFSHATDVLLDLIGMDDPWRREHRLTVYTLETHVRYLREVGLDAMVRVDCRLLELDHKRLRLFHTMSREDDGTLLATAEMLLVHIDQSGPKSAPWTNAVRQQLDDLHARQANEAWPEGAGRAITLAPRLTIQEGQA